MRWNLLADAAEKIIKDPDCLKYEQNTVVGEAVLYPGITVQVTKQEGTECPK